MFSWFLFYSLVAIFYYLGLRYTTVIYLNSYKCKLNVIFICFITFVICATRDVNLGSDYKTYVAMYQYVDDSQKIPDYLSSRGLLFGYSILISSFLNIPYNIYFGFVGALIIFLFIKSNLFYSSDNRFISLTIVFFVFDGFFLWSQSGLRQAIAVGIFLYSVRYIISGEFYKYIFFMIIGMGFHSASILLIPAYFIRRFRFNKLFILILFLLALSGIVEIILVSVIPSIIDIIFSKLTFFSGYLQYADIERIGNSEEVKGTGLAFLFRLIVNLILLYFSGYLIKLMPKLEIVFSLYFFGVIITLAFPYSEIIVRYAMFYKMIFPTLFALLLSRFISLPLTLLALGFTALYYVIFLTQVEQLYSAFMIY
ncbi:EpsG family protein [Vibrio cyclitrophicus]